ncbi:Sytl5p [Blomia tropicalis]|nr:Sytl5p [Blomia tropicalis]
MSTTMNNANSISAGVVGGSKLTNRNGSSSSTATVISSDLDPQLSDSESTEFFYHSQNVPTTTTTIAAAQTATTTTSSINTNSNLLDESFSLFQAAANNLIPDNTIQFDRQQLFEFSRYFPIYQSQIANAVGHGGTGIDNEQQQQQQQSSIANRRYQMDDANADIDIIDVSDDIVEHEKMKMNGKHFNHPLNYENYMTEFDADYEQYYDPNNQHQQHHYHPSSNEYRINRMPIGSYHVEEIHDHNQIGVEVDEEEAEIELGDYFDENEISIEMDDEMNGTTIGADNNKTYSVMLPPYDQTMMKNGSIQAHQQQQQQVHHPIQMHHQQFSMIQHPYMYNPFSYQLHTIVEESENETSSLQTMSSINSNYQQPQQQTPSLQQQQQQQQPSSLSYEGANHRSSPSKHLQTSTNNKNIHTRGKIVLGELSDQSIGSPNSSVESSPTTREKFPKNRINSSSCGENLSQISFTSSSSSTTTYSDGHSSEAEDDETSIFMNYHHHQHQHHLNSPPLSPLQIETMRHVANVKEQVDEDDLDLDPHQATLKYISSSSSTEFINPHSTLDGQMMANVAITGGTNLLESELEPMSSTSKLERYFTTSLLEANKPKNNDHSNHTKLSNVQMKQMVEPIKLTKLISSNVSTMKPINKSRTIRSILLQLLTDKHYRPLTFKQLNQLNQIFQLDWIRFLQTIIVKMDMVALMHHHIAKVVALYLTKLSANQLNQHANVYLIDYEHSGPMVSHLIHSNRISSQYYIRSNIDQKMRCNNNNSENNNNVETHCSQIKITINEDQSMIIIQNDNDGTTTIPKIPARLKKEAKLRTMNVDSNDTSNNKATIYRTVLQINNINEQMHYNQSNTMNTTYRSNLIDNSSSSSNNNNNNRIQRLHKQPNPLNRTFIAKTKLNVMETPVETLIDQQSKTKMPKMEKESDRNGARSTSESTTKPAKTRSGLLNSSTQLLLGSLRSRAKWNDQYLSNERNDRKFKTISNISRPTSTMPNHSKLSGCRSINVSDESNNEDSLNDSKLERYGKGSKSFRDSKASMDETNKSSSITTGGGDGTTSTPTTTTKWDTIYGGGMKLLKNISFVRSRSRSSHKDMRDGGELSTQTNDNSCGPSRSKSLSEPNLHRNRARAIARELAQRSTVDEMINDSIDETKNKMVLSPPPPMETSLDSSNEINLSSTTSTDSNVEKSLSTSHLMVSNQSDSNVDCEMSTTHSTPSILYQLSNPRLANMNSTVNSGSRSISTMSLRRVRITSNETINQSLEPTTTTTTTTTSSLSNGEWQSMSTNDQSIESKCSTRSNRNGTNNNIHQTINTATVSTNLNQNVPYNNASHLHQSKDLSLSSSIDTSSMAIVNNHTTSKANIATDFVNSYQNFSDSLSPIVVGHIALSLNYEMRIGSLEISIHKCRVEIVAKQKADLYVKVYLMPDRSKASKKKTRIVKAYRLPVARTSNELHAEFNETLRFVGPFGEFTGRRLSISIWNNDKFGRNGPVAETILGPLDTSILSSEELSILHWYRLMEPMAIMNESNGKSTTDNSGQVNLIKQQQPQQQQQQSLLQTQTITLMTPEDDQLMINQSTIGSIFLAIKYETDSTGSSLHSTECSFGTLNILLKEAQNLKFRLTPNGSTIIGSTYCKLSLQPERNKLDRDKSVPIKCKLEHSSNPRWNQEFKFHNLTIAELSQRTLYITVWFQSEYSVQKSSGKKLFVGGLRLSSDSSESIADEVSLWNQTLDRPNFWAYGEIPLRVLKDIP